MCEAAGSSLSGQKQPMTTDKNCPETALKGAYESREIQPLLHGLQEEPIGNILEVCSHKLPCSVGADG
jgi:hypothetical protein